MSDWLTIPGQPIGQGRPRCTCRGGFARVYDPERSRQWKEAARAILQSQKPSLIEAGPVVLEIEIVLNRPKAFKHGPRQPHVAKPDASNVAKIVEDAANGVVFADDSQIALLKVWKWYAASGEEPHVRLRAERL